VNNKDHGNGYSRTSRTKCLRTVYVLKLHLCVEYWWYRA